MRLIFNSEKTSSSMFLLHTLNVLSINLLFPTNYYILSSFMLLFKQTCIFGLNFILIVSNASIYKPCHDKTCLHGLCDQIRFKPAFSAIEASKRLGILDIASVCIIRLHRCIGWSEPLMFTYGIRQLFSWHDLYIERNTHLGFDIKVICRQQDCCVLELTHAKLEWQFNLHIFFNHSYYITTVPRVFS